MFFSLSWFIFVHISYALSFSFHDITITCYAWEAVFFFFSNSPLTITCYAWWTVILYHYFLFAFKYNVLCVTDCYSFFFLNSPLTTTLRCYSDTISYLDWRNLMKMLVNDVFSLSIYLCGCVFGCVWLWLCVRLCSCVLVYAPVWPYMHLNVFTHTSTLQ